MTDNLNGWYEVFYQHPKYPGKVWPVTVLIENGKPRTPPFHTESAIIKVKELEKGKKK